MAKGLTVTFLLYQTVCRDGEGCGCLHLAAQFGLTALVAYLVARGQQNLNYHTKPLCRDVEGCGCLHLAAQFAHTALVAYQVAKGHKIP